MSRLLVTGASGFLGWNICRSAANRYQTTGIVNTHPCTLENVDVRMFDLADCAHVGKLVQEIKPDYVIHAAAQANPNYCQHHAQATQRINVEVPYALARACAAQGVRLVFTSTDLVFDGEHAPYTETDPAHPLSRYGRQKRAAEIKIGYACPSALICRLPLMFGDAPSHASSFLQPMLAAIEQGRQQTLFADEYRTIVSAISAAHGIVLLLEKGVSGIFHLGGRERFSRCGFGELLAQILHRRVSLNPAKRSDMKTPAPRPADVSLDSSKAFALGYAPALAKDSLVELACLRNVRSG
ncbi:MAG: sugar nucleotide-binding protein [Chitinivibrionales bacterium]|nr:sugar nucleotide-binding protein [Chitinivibrionales bacterium]